MKTKTKNNNALIAILTVIIAICAIFTFVPMQFGDTTYTGVWGSIGFSSEVYGGLYAEYDISGEYSEEDVLESTAIIKGVLEEEGYQYSNVYSINGEKVRVEIGYPSVVADTFTDAYSTLTSIGVGEFEFRSKNSDEDYVSVSSKTHLKDLSVSDYNGTTYLTFEFNEEGEKVFEELCNASSTIYVYMGGDMKSSFSLGEGMTSYSQMQLSVDKYPSAMDLYYNVKYGSILITLNPDTVVINTMTSVLSLGATEGLTTLFYVLCALIAVVLVASFVFFAIKYKMVAALLAPIILLDLVIAAWLFAAISVIEINITSLIAIILGLAVIFAGSLYFVGRIAEEYKQGKTIGASIEAGTKKARPALVASSVAIVVLLATFALCVKGQIATASLILGVIFGALSALTNIVLLPWLIKLYNKSNRKQGLPFGLTQGDNANV